MKKIALALGVATLLGFSLTACGNSGRSVLTPPPPPGITTYTQIERLSRPAVKELFETFVNHQVSNAVEPYNDPTLQNSITAFANTVRPPANGANYGNTLASVLYPDELTVNLAGISPTAANADPYYFLSEVADGANYFGGRAPNDDVIGLELGIVFGNTLQKLGVQPEDNAENNCLSAQNITENAAKQTTATFPYLAQPSQ